MQLDINRNFHNLIKNAKADTKYFFRYQNSKGGLYVKNKMLISSVRFDMK